MVRRSTTSQASGKSRKSCWALLSLTATRSPGQATTSRPVLPSTPLYGVFPTYRNVIMAVSLPLHLLPFSLHRSGNQKPSFGGQLPPTVHACVLLFGSALRPPALSFAPRRSSSTLLVETIVGHLLPLPGPASWKAGKFQPPLHWSTTARTSNIHAKAVEVAFMVATIYPTATKNGGVIA